MKRHAAFVTIVAATAGFAVGLHGATQQRRAAEHTSDEYALILDDPPLAADGGRLSIRALDVAAKQTRLAGELLRRNLIVSGTARLFANVVFIRVPRGSRPDVANLPYVKAVTWLPPLKRQLNTALGLAQITSAWNNPAIGGQGNAGAGIKIGIVDSGIDHLNPAFDDAALSLPAGFPKVSDPSFAGVYTNNKIIAARSYVADLSSSDPRYSSPDDRSPVDRTGHGTAVAMIAAGQTINGPAASITGAAPKAFLGNYKIFGSPGVNDYTTNLAFITALEDAFNDAMDVVVASLGSPARIAPLDNNCSTNALSYVPAGICDVVAYAVENAVLSGMSVVVAAGDDAQSGNASPALSTINTPGTAPDAITVGATSNLHTLVNSVIPANGAPIDGLFGDSTKPTGPLTAPLEVPASDPAACGSLPPGSLNGAIALVIRGGCDFDVKINFAQAAGAVGVVLYLDNPADNIFVPTSIAETFIPAILVSHSSGLALAADAGARGFSVTLDPRIRFESISADAMAPYSSRGPSIGVYGSNPIFTLKPDLVAPGADVYTATQTLDPNGKLYDPSGFTSAGGTSFAAPIVAGAVALVKQAHPAFTPGQLKSAIVTTATQNVTEGEASANWNAMGAGKVNAAGALNVALTCDPPNVHFGVLNGVGSGAQISANITLTNVTDLAAAVSFSVSQSTPDNLASVAVSPRSLTILPGQAGTVTLAVNGEPNPGFYDGQLNITGAGPALHVSYQYLEGDNTAAVIFPVSGDGLLNTPGSASNLLAFRVLDQYGVPVSTSANWSVTSGSGIISQADQAPDQYGAAGAFVTFGPRAGTQIFEGGAGGLNWNFTETVANAPSISGYGNAGNFGTSVAPGSYIAIIGSDLSATSSPYLKTPYLPLSLAATSVTFDAGTVSVPAPLSYISPGQVNVQVPWELAGQASAVMKVSRDYLVSATRTIPLSTSAPGIFEYRDLQTGQLEAAAQDAHFKLVGSANPVARGETLILYATGMGPVDHAQITGVVAAASPLANTTQVPVVTIGGQTATVLFSGLTPGFVSLYQINATVEPGTPTGLQPLTVTVNGAASQISHVYVQ